MIIPCGDDLVVESEHDALLLRLGVVVAEQVKQTVTVGHSTMSPSRPDGGSSSSPGARISSMGKLSTSVGPGRPMNFSW